MGSREEYTIFCRCGQGKPYNLHTFDNLEVAKIKLYDIISLEQERNRPYYVHNDFYENEYPPTVGCKIFCIKKRTISDWEIYSQLEEQLKHNSEEHNNVILFKKTI